MLNAEGNQELWNDKTDTQLTMIVIIYP